MTRAVAGVVAIALSVAGCSALPGLVGGATTVLDSIAADAERTAANIRARRADAKAEMLLKDILAAIEEIRTAQERAAEESSAEHKEIRRDVVRGWVRLEGLLIKLEEREHGVPTAEVTP